MVFKKIRSRPSRWLICPPLQYRWDIITMLHDVLGHSGVSQTLTVLHQHFHWPGVKRDVALFISTCEPCQKVKALSPPLLPIQRPVLFAPMDHVHLDLFGPYDRMLSDPPSGPRDRTKIYVLVMVDYFTKVAELVPIDNKIPMTVARAFFNHWICRYGVPSVVTTDNGAEFLSDFAHMISRLGIKRISTSPNHPPSNGAAERLVQTIKTMLTTHFNDHPYEWTVKLPFIQHAYMRSPHSALNGLAPFEMLYAYLPKLPLAVGDVLVNNVLVDITPQQYYQHATDVKEKRQKQISLVLEQRMHKHIMARQKHLSRKHKQPQLKVGDLVMELPPSSGPLSTNIKGPFLVMDLNVNQNIAILQTGGTANKPKRLFKRHTSHLVVFKDKPPPSKLVILAAVLGGGVSAVMQVPQIEESAVV